MSKKEKSIELLNKAVNDESLTVHQIYVFSFPEWWYGIRFVKRIAIQEMMHVEQLAERTLFLKREVEMKNADSVSKKLFGTLTVEKEVHQDQFETELDNLEKFGDHYLALQSIERSKSVATGTPAE